MDDAARAVDEKSSRGLTGPHTIAEARAERRDRLLAVDRIDAQVAKRGGPVPLDDEHRQWLVNALNARAHYLHEARTLEDWLTERREGLGTLLARVREIFVEMPDAQADCIEDYDEVLDQIEAAQRMYAPVGE